MRTFSKLALVAGLVIATGAATIDTSSAQWRHRHHGGAWAAGAAGLVAGAAIGSALAQPRYYGPDYAYGYYAPDYAYAPGYVYEDYGYDAYAYAPRSRGYLRRSQRSGVHGGGEAGLQ